MNTLANTCNCYKCPCGNITISLKSVCERTDLPSCCVSSAWENPIYTSTGIISVKYPQFKTVLNLPSMPFFSMLHCKLCDKDICCYVPTSSPTSGTSLIINPLLRNTEELRKEKVYSNTYELYVNNCEVEENNSWCSNDPIERMLFQKKQDFIDALFEEKERKVREFVLKQEEIFEEKRREAKKHYLMLKKQCSDNSIKGSSSCHSPSPIKAQPSTEIKQNHQQHYLSHQNVFFFDEDSDSTYEPTYNTNFMKEKALMDNRVFSRINYAPNDGNTQNSVPVFSKKQEKTFFPATFKEFVFEKIQQESYEKPSSAFGSSIKRALI